MGLPSQKRTLSSKRKRASHFALSKKQLSVCSQCNAHIVSHRACSKCGYYKGTKVLTRTRSDRLSRKKKSSS